MRVALTFNLRRSSHEDEAEFDTKETIDAIASLLASLGHVVVPVEATCSVQALASRLRRAAPDLVFNLAEGRRGPFREAFYPALFDELGLAYTGSSASTLAVCLDKALAKSVVSAAGVPVPRGALVRSLADIDLLPRVARSVIVKPNLEGSSKGITQRSVVDDPRALSGVVRDLLARYPGGVLVEELIDGDDVSVGWVEGLGLLPPIGFAYEPTGRHRILDYGLKRAPDRVRLEIPARLDTRVLSSLAAIAARAFAALGVEGFGRADFRVTPSGAIRFLEMNPLPTLAPSDEELYAAAALLGATPRDLLAAIVAEPAPSPASRARSVGVERSDDRKIMAPARATSIVS